MDPEREQAFKRAVLSYKYTSPTLSLLERLFLNEFWAKVAEMYPPWLAPNLITLGGYVCVWAAYINTIAGSPTLMGELPGWRYALNAALFFLYQTLDGSDGKQARRTKSGSALGELMDHGVDAVVTTLLALLVADVFRFGILSVWPWTFVAVALLSFFLSNMTLVHSGRQVFFDLDVMEIQTTMILTLLGAAVGGTEMFDQVSIPLPSALHGVKTDLWGMLQPGEEVDFTGGTMSLKLFVVIGGLGGCLFNYPQYIFHSARPYLLLKPEDRPEHIKKGVPGSGFAALVLHLVLIHSFFALCATSVYYGTRLATPARSESAMRAFAVLVAFCFGDLMDRVLLMRVAHEPLPVVPKGLVPLLAFAVLAAFDANVEKFEGSNQLLSRVAWWNLLAFLAWVQHHAYFARSVMSLASALGIHPFKIRATKDE